MGLRRTELQTIGIILLRWRAPTCEPSDRSITGPSKPQTSFAGAEGTPDPCVEASRSVGRSLGKHEESSGSIPPAR